MFEAEDRNLNSKSETELLSAKLLKTRTIIISQEVSDELARSVLAQLLILEAESPTEPIRVFINSPGGAADSGFAIFDMLRFVKPEVKIICAGLVASAAAIILLGAKREHRFSLPNSRILIHQPSTMIQGYAADVAISAVEIVKLRERANKLIAAETGKPLEKVERDTNRDYWMSPEEALEYGLISKIIRSHRDV
jgi:ATP-dependent Clp protease protease subunit